MEKFKLVKFQEISESSGAEIKNEPKEKKHREALKELESKEDGLVFKKLADYFRGLPRNFFRDNKNVKSAAVLALLLKASTLFTGMAWAQEQKKYAPGDKPVLETILNLKDWQKLEPPFDWKKIVDEISLTYEAPYIDKSGRSAEDIGFNLEDIHRSTFFQDFSEKERYAVEDLYFHNFRESESAQDFFSRLEKSADKYDQRQEAYFLMRLNAELSKIYDDDMGASDEHIEISDEEIYNALKTGKKKGICGNFATFFTKVAKKIGIEAWLQSGVVQGGKHIYAGAVVENQGRKQIVFFDFASNSLTATGTLNYQKALGIKEQRDGEVVMFNSYIGDASKNLFPVQSEALEIMENVAGFGETDKKLSEKLEAGGMKKERKLEIKFGPEFKEIRLNRNSIGICYINYRDSGNPYNSLEELNAARGSLRLGGKGPSFEADATYMHFDIKSLQNGVFPRDAVGYELHSISSACSRRIRQIGGQLWGNDRRRNRLFCKKRSAFIKKYI